MLKQYNHDAAYQEAALKTINVNGTCEWTVSKVITDRIKPYRQVWQEKTDFRCWYVCPNTPGIHYLLPAVSPLIILLDFGKWNRRGPEKGQCGNSILARRRGCKQVVRAVSDVIKDKPKYVCRQLCRLDSTTGLLRLKMNKVWTIKNDGRIRAMRGNLRRGAVTEPLGMKLEW